MQILLYYAIFKKIITCDIFICILFVLPQQFKTEAYQQQIEMERLNHQAELLLKKVTEESDKHTVQDPLSELKLLWDSLEEKIISRQVNKFEHGSFIHDLDF